MSDDFSERGLRAFFGVMFVGIVFAIVAAGGGLVVLASNMRALLAQQEAPVVAVAGGVDVAPVSAVVGCADASFEGWGRMSLCWADVGGARCYFWYPGGATLSCRPLGAP